MNKNRKPVSKPVAVVVILGGELDAPAFRYCDSHYSEGGSRDGDGLEFAETHAVKTKRGMGPLKYAPVRL